MNDDQDAINRKARVDAKMRDKQLKRISEAALLAEKKLLKLYDMTEQTLDRRVPVDQAWRLLDELHRIIDETQSIYAMAYAAQSEREQVTAYAVH